LIANIFNFNYLYKYSGALHLSPLRQTFIYKYYGAPHLLDLFKAAEMQNICRDVFGSYRDLSLLQSGRNAKYL
jgi:hypothetical protein